MATTPLYTLNHVHIIINYYTFDTRLEDQRCASGQLELPVMATPVVVCSSEKETGDNT